MNGQKTIKRVVESVLKDVDEYGLDKLSDRITGHFAEFRKYELAFAMNRLRDFKVKQRKNE